MCGINIGYFISVDGKNVENKANVRENIGKSMIDFPKEYVVLDLETTGLDSRWNEIIEIAAIKVSNNEIVGTYQSLIKPKYEIDEYIEELTGITNDMVKNSPTIDEKILEFVNYIGPSIIIGHNVHFDIKFIYDNLMKVYSKEFSNNYIDTLRFSRKIYKELKHHRLSDMLNHLDIKNENEHRALSDAMATHELFNKLKYAAVEKFGSEENFINSFKKNRKFTKASQIVTDIKEFDESHPLYNKTVVFTGTLEKLVRKEAMQLVVNNGGHVKDSVVKSTNYLVLGTQDYSRLSDGEKSSKMKKAEKLKLAGNDIDIISEDIFYELIFEN